MLRGAVESLVNVFTQPRVFYEDVSESWQPPLTYNAFYAAVIAAISSVFTILYYDILARLGWRGVGLALTDIVIQPVVVVLSVVVWSAVVYATLRFYDYDGYSSMLNVVAYSWLASYPYALVSAVIYFVQTGVGAESASTALGVTLYIVQIMLSIASITHITIASVHGLKERLGATWQQGVLATIIVPIVLAAIVFTVGYLATV